MSKKGSDLSDWYASQYAAAVGLADVGGSAALQQFLARNPEPDGLGDPMMSGRHHMDAFMHLRLRFPISPQVEESDIAQSAAALLTASWVRSLSTSACRVPAGSPAPRQTLGTRGTQSSGSTRAMRPRSHSRTSLMSPG